MFGTDPVGATPLSEEDIKGLRQQTVLDRKTLSQVEAENIVNAKVFFLTHKKKYKNLNFLLSDECIKDVHRKMFDEVWNWAGQYRKHDTNIGIHWSEIPEATRKLSLNYRERSKYLSQNQDEIDLFAAEFHYDLVKIHPFPNGNGRLARQMADLFLIAQNTLEFTWGGIDFVNESIVRSSYIEALRHADSHDTHRDFTPLLDIARH